MNTRLDRQFAGRILLAAGLALAAGCGQRPAEQATEVILPGEQQLTPPERPEVAETTAPQETAGESSAAASKTVASAPASTGASAGAAPAKSTTPAPSTASASTETTGTDMALLKGRVTVDGALPALPPLKPKDDPTVQDKACVANAIPDDSVYGKDGGLADVFVFAKRLPSGVTAPQPPAEPAVLDQVGCRFVPQAFVLRTGQPLQMKNSDPVSHNVRTASLNMPINQIISPSNQEGTTVTYERPERLPVQTRCDIHAWMLGYHLPVDHPYAAVTAEDGTFEIKDLPPGDWEFMVWHGKAGYVERTVTVKAAAGQVIVRDFKVPASKLSK